MKFTLSQLSLPYIVALIAETLMVEVTDSKEALVVDSVVVIFPEAFNELIELALVNLQMW